MHPFHSAYSDLPPAQPLWPLWHLGIGVFVVGAVLGCLSWLLMNSLPQKPRQQSPCQCSCDAYDAAHQTAYDGCLVGLPRSGLGLAVKQAHLPLRLGQQPLWAVGGIAALPPGKLGITPLAHSSNVELLQLFQLASFHEIACKPRERSVHPYLP